MSNSIFVLSELKKSISSVKIYNDFIIHIYPLQNIIDISLILKTKYLLSFEIDYTELDIYDEKDNYLFSFKKR